MLFKVLGADGEAIHGGSGHWPLPHDGEPGEWVEIEGEPAICRRGLHLIPATAVMQWRKPKATIYAAEPDLTQPASYDESPKGAFKRARLLYQITVDWPLLPLFPTIRVFLATAGADLSGADLSRADLSRANLSRANLSGANRPDDPPPDGWEVGEQDLLKPKKG